MADQLQLRGGTTNEHSTFTGALREVTVDTDKDTLIVHDAATAGGHPLLREDGSNSALSLGTAGTPSIKFTGDTNTGLYSPGADQVAISTGGSGRLFVDASGRVGVGAASPYNVLTGKTLNIGDGTAGAEITLLSTTTGSGALWFGDATSGLAAISGYLEYNHNSNYMRFGTASEERLRIDSSGRLLVGTSSARSGWFNTTVDAALIQSETTDLNVFSGVQNSANAFGPWMLLGKSRGSSAGAVTVVQNNDQLGSISFQGADGTEMVEGAKIQAFVDGTPGTNDMPGRLVFSTTADGAASPTERMRIDSSGNVGIGSTPVTLGKLQVKQTATTHQGGISVVNPADNSKLSLWGSGSEFNIDAIFTTTGNYKPIAFRTSNGERMRIDSSGRVGVGTSSFPGSGKLQVAGGNASTGIGGAGCISLLDGDANNEFNNLKFDTSAGGPIAAIGAKATTTGAYPNSVGELHFAVQNGASTNTALVIDSSSRVGVGTTSPSYPLHVLSSDIQCALDAPSSSTYTQISFRNNNTQKAAFWWNNSTSEFESYVGAGADYTWNVGNEKMRLDSSGRLGIGTSSPATTLHINKASSTTNFTGLPYPAENSGIYIDNFDTSGAGTFNGLNFRISNGSTSQSYGLVAQSVAAGYAPDLHFVARSGPNASTSRMVLDSGGRLGIGTTTPDRKLSVSDTTDGLLARFIGPTNNLFIANDRSGVIDLFSSGSGDHLAFGTENAEKLRIDSSGRLLVGTTSTSASTRLVVQGNSASSSGTGSIYLRRGNDAIGSGVNIGEIVFSNNADQTGAYIQATSDGAWTLGSSHPTRLGFFTTASGASSPTESMKLDDAGRLYVPDVYASTTGAAANVVVESSGRIRRSTSSAKYKTQIETLEDVYSDNLLNCRPVWYRSTCEGDDPYHSYWGFIAEEVAEIDPRLVFWKTLEVTYDENGSVVTTPCDPEPEGVQYDRFVPHLLNLIKRQKEQIEAMEARLSALEAS